MADKFLGTGGSGNVNISNGTTDIFAATLSSANLDPSRPIKTNSVRELVSSNLDIADINNLQPILDNIITQPYIGTLKATDFETDNYLSVNNELQKIDNLTASTEAPDTTNITGLLNSDELATGRVYDETQSTFIELDGTDVNVIANDLKLNGFSVLTDQTPLPDVSNLETKTQNISLTTTSGQTDIEGVINNIGITEQKVAILTQQLGATNTLEGTWGFAFDVNNPISINKLKILLTSWSDPSNTKQVGIWEDGNATAIYTGTITKTNVVGGYAVENIIPVPLTVGIRYILGFRFKNVDNFDATVNPPQSTEITVYGQRRNNNTVGVDAGFSYPFAGNGNDGRASYGNFEFVISDVGQIRTSKIIMEDIDGVGFLADITEGLKVRDGIKSINYDDDAFMRITSSSNLFNFNWTSADIPANNGDWITYSQSGGTDGTLTISPPNFNNGELQLLGANLTIDSDFFLVDCETNATDFIKYQGGVDYLNPPGLNSLAAVGYVDEKFTDPVITGNLTLTGLLTNGQGSTIDFSNGGTLTASAININLNGNITQTGSNVSMNSSNIIQLASANLLNMVSSVNANITSPTIALNGSITTNGEISSESAIAFNEVSTPTNKPNYGKLYMNDNQLKYKFGDNIYPIAGPQLSGIYDATNDTNLYEDDNIIIKWDGTNKQPVFEGKFTGYWDCAMEVIKDDDAIYANQDIFVNFNNDYYLTGLTTPDVQYNAVNYSTQFNCSIHKEDGDRPSYLFTIKTGDISGPAVFDLRVVNIPSAIAFNVDASSERIPSPQVVRVSNRTRIEQLEAKQYNLSNVRAADTYDINIENGTGTTLYSANRYMSGVMSREDKIKLDTIWNWFDTNTSSSFSTDNQINHIGEIIGKITSLEAQVLELTNKLTILTSSE